MPGKKPKQKPPKAHEAPEDEAAPCARISITSPTPNSSLQSSNSSTPPSIHQTHLHQFNQQSSKNANSSTPSLISISTIEEPQPTGPNALHLPSNPSAPTPICHLSHASALPTTVQPESRIKQAHISPKVISMFNLSRIKSQVWVISPLTSNQITGKQVYWEKTQLINTV